VSDLQDLIHTNAHNAYEIGVRTERERILAIVQDNVFHHPGYCDWECPSPCENPSFLEFMALIKGEQK
jgi:hypothetical protein